MRSSAGLSPSLMIHIYIIQNGHTAPILLADRHDLLVNGPLPGDIDIMHDMVICGRFVYFLPVKQPLGVPHTETLDGSGLVDPPLFLQRFLGFLPVLGFYLQPYQVLGGILVAVLLCEGLASLSLPVRSRRTKSSTPRT